MIDESTLSQTDRLGLAWCRLNKWEWDEILGPKPKDFDHLPKTLPNGIFVHRSQLKSKIDYTRPAKKAIESVIGEANASRCWHVYELGRTEEEWLRWYLVHELPDYCIDRLL